MDLMTLTYHLLNAPLGFSFAKICIGTPIAVFSHSRGQTTNVVSLIDSTTSNHPAINPKAVAK
jgi:hypothetical protein